MASRKIKDVLVTVGTYKDSGGTEKNRYQNVGVVMESDNGHQFVLLERWFNPAGVVNPDGRTTVMLSLSTPRDSTQQQDAPRAQPTRPAPAPNNDFEDDIPF